MAAWEEAPLIGGGNGQSSGTATAARPAWESAPLVDREPQQQEGLMDTVRNLFTGEDRQTRATQKLPELQNSGLFKGLDIPAGQQAALFAALPTTTDAGEIAKMLRASSPYIGVSQDEKGNLIAANNKTGVQAVINKPGLSGLDVAQAAGIGAAFTPAARGASWVGGGLGRQAIALGAGSAATQAGIEGLQQEAGGDVDGGEIAAAGALGAATPAVASAIGGVADTGRRVLAAARNPAAGPNAQLVQQAEQVNVPLMTSDVFPPQTFMSRSAQIAGERIPFAGTGGARQAQQDARVAAVEGLGRRYPQPDQDQLMDSLTENVGRRRRAAGERIGRIEQQLDTVGPVPYTRTEQAVSDAIAELNRPGVVGSAEATNELRQFMDTLNSAPQTYSTLRENRTAWRDVVNSFDGAARSQLPSRARALMSRVYSALREDMDEVASANLSAQERIKLRRANIAYGEEAGRVSNTRLKSVLDKGEMTPELAESLLFSRKPSEVRNLYQSLGTEGRQAARATIIQKAIRDAQGTEGLSPDRFLNNIRKLETQTGVFFRDADRRQLEGLRQVLDATRRGGQAGVQTATGQQTYSIGAATAAATAGLKAIPVAGAIGGFARLYESAPVRNALIRLAENPNTGATVAQVRELAATLSPYFQAFQAAGGDSDNSEAVAPVGEQQQGVAAPIEMPAVDTAQPSSGEEMLPPADEQLPDVEPAQDLERIPGMIEAGNIDLHSRPIVRNEDGSISTVRSISANFDGREVLIPTVSDDGRILTDGQAIQQYLKTGRHLGVFDSPQDATAYAQQLHDDQAKEYLPQADQPVLRADGMPFDGAGSARASRAYREALAQGRRPEVVKVDGGFAVRTSGGDLQPGSAVDRAASDAAMSPDNDLPEPTDAQKEAGNYRKGHVRFQGLDISIENPRGSERKGVGKNGKVWSHTMSDHYGYIKRTSGADGEQVDVYLGPQEHSDRVFVIDQDDQKGGFDEHKVMLGYSDRAAAVKAYRSNFDRRWKVGKVTPMSMAEFKRWLKEGKTDRPMS